MMVNQLNACSSMWLLAEFPQFSLSCSLQYAWHKYLDSWSSLCWWVGCMNSDREEGGWVGEHLDLLFWFHRSVEYYIHIKAAVPNVNFTQTAYNFLVFRFPASINLKMSYFGSIWKWKLTVNFSSTTAVEIHSDGSGHCNFSGDWATHRDWR
jgi:hypothetical protein